MVKNSNEEKSLRDAAMPPLPFAHQIKKENEDKRDKVVTLKQAREKIQEMQAFCDEIELQLEEVYRQTGWSPQFVEAYLNNANNFKVADWERINKQRKDLMASIMLPQDLQKEAEKAKNPQNADNDNKLAKERRKKSAGMRRRNWLPMR